MAYIKHFQSVICGSERLCNSLLGSVMIDRVTTAARDYCTRIMLLKPTHLALQICMHSNSLG